MPLNGQSLLKRLPKTHGKLLPDEPLADQTWFRAGGPAEILFKPVDAGDLAGFLGKCPADIPVTVLGVASNTLVRDGGIPGVVVKLGPSFAQVKADGENLSAGAGAIDLNVARAAATAGIGGMEFLSGIPGTVGGGLRMNAGAYGSEFKDITLEAHAILRDGTRKKFSHAEIGFSYRHTDAPEDCIFVSATLRGKAGDPKEIQQKMQDIQKSRADTQPIREKTGGSTFANPEDDLQRRKSWQLIDGAGCRSLMIGGAQVSEKHCNFLINTGHATAADIENLGEEVRRRVLEKYGVTLRWEIRRIGIKTEEV